MHMDRILIVDDEFLIRYTLEEGLKDRGYDAYSAATVEEGLEFVRKYHPGVLLLDNLLENSVGMDEIVNFKNADEELQVIMMTAYGSVSQAVEATKRGAYDYILKPFDVDEIDMLIKRCLEQKRNRDSPVFLKGGIPEATNLVVDLRENHGIFCSMVVYPVIPKGEIILRIIPTAVHTLEDVKVTIEAFKAVREKLETGVYASMPIPARADEGFMVR